MHKSRVIYISGSRHIPTFHQGLVVAPLVRIGKDDGNPAIGLQ